MTTECSIHGFKHSIASMFFSSNLSENKVPDFLPACPTPQVLSLSPRLLMVEGFLSAAECKEMMEVAGPRLIRSRVSSGEHRESMQQHTDKGVFPNQRQHAYT